MKRSKLKGTVIFLLIVANILLFVMIKLEDFQSQHYEAMGRDQALIYLQKNGITADAKIIPWKTDLTGEADDAVNYVAPEQKDLVQRTTDWEIQPMRQPETMLVDFVIALREAGKTCTEIQKIEEYYYYQKNDSQAVLTPFWRLYTDQGVFCLNASEGSLIQCQVASQVP